VTIQNSNLRNILTKESWLVAVLIVVRRRSPSSPIEVSLQKNILQNNTKHCPVWNSKHINSQQETRWHLKYQEEYVVLFALLFSWLHAFCLL